MYNRAIQRKKGRSGKLEQKQTTILGTLGRKLRTQFLTGVVAVIPIGVTLGILIWIFVTFDSILEPLVKLVFGRPVPGVGFGITLLLIYLIGVITSNVLGKKLLQFGESLLAKVPLVWQLYIATKEIVNSFRRSEESAFTQVVLVEFPRKGMRTIAFVTHETADKQGRKLLNIFVPTSPNPMSGFLQIAREDEVIRTDISVDDALKMVVSAGKISSPEIEARLGAQD